MGLLVAACGPNVPPPQGAAIATDAEEVDGGDLCPPVARPRYGDEPPLRIAAVPSPVTTDLSHDAVPEQLWNHPVPIAVEASPPVTDGWLCLYFAAESDYGFYGTVMLPETVDDGSVRRRYDGEIPCTIIQPRRWFYFVALMNRDGEAGSTVGSPEQPLVVEMVEHMQGPSPVYRNGEPASSCGPNGEGPMRCRRGLPCE